MLFFCNSGVGRKDFLEKQFMLFDSGVGGEKERNREGLNFFFYAEPDNNRQSLVSCKINGSELF